MNTKMATSLPRVLLHLTLLAIVITVAIARPGNFDEFGTHEDKCKTGDPTVVEVCQRCAKRTKSTIVYPMCCTNQEDVYNWCGRFMNYGKKAKRRVTL